MGTLPQHLRATAGGRSLESLLAAAQAGATALSVRQVWQRLADAVMVVVIVGGVLVVPIAFIMAIIGFALPSRAMLHTSGPQFLAFAILWFLVAVFCAHSQVRPQTDQDLDADAPADA